MADLIEPRVLKGFRDLLPENELNRKEIIQKLENVFHNFGFMPIDTPVLEYAEVLLGKGGGETDKQVYRFLDNGKRDVALRFDLTVPFARYMAAHGKDLPIPFRRYHAAKVWRGENTQRGRYREFMQCDFDIVGIDTPTADFEIILLIKRCFEALGIHEITIEISHRGVFDRFIRSLDLADKQIAILRLVDKISKIGIEKVRQGLAEITSVKAVDEILNFISKENTFLDTITKMEKQAGGPAEDTQRLRQIFGLLSDVQVDGVVLNPAITRGLDYYTGLVCETFLTNIPEIGSVCSGGRYNDLASLYSKQQYPGVGASIGLDRLTAALVELGTVVENRSIPEVLIFNLDSALTAHYYRLATALRNSDISCEVYFEKRKLAQQFQYAEKKGIPVGLICGSDEYEHGTVSIKNLITRDSVEGLTHEQAIAKIREIASIRNMNSTNAI
jgi:histidyl-tRNA synthetase